jgi:hypothetical protein
VAIDQPLGRRSCFLDRSRSILMAMSSVAETGLKGDT